MRKHTAASARASSASVVCLKERIRSIYLKMMGPSAPPPYVFLKEELAPVRRIPVTQDYLAHCVAAEVVGKPVNHPASGHFYEALYRSISRMVFMLCQKYALSCRDTVDDLAQDCMLKIVKYMGRFDPKICSFTTWCWRLCTVTLITKYRNSVRHVNDVPWEFEEPTYQESYEPSVSVLQSEVRDTIRGLLKRYPRKRNMILAMFGNPNQKSFQCPDSVDLSATARTLGIKYSSAYIFYREAVCPYFQKRFA